MTQSELHDARESQRAFFAAGSTLPAAYRAGALAALEGALRRHETALTAALRQDLGKSAAEAGMSELGLVYAELHWMQRHLRGLMRDRTVPTPLAQFAARSFCSPSPLGTVLIMSPWNYPVLLTLDPLIDALAAGNTAFVKPSAYAPATAAALQALLEECFSPDYVCVVTGGRAENQALLREPFDLIFFTGSKAVGREVLHAAADRLTPVVLELGGKSPCIVDETAKLHLAARRIVFAKFLNCGQTCVAPDYILCPASRQDALAEALRREIAAQFGADPLANPDYGRIVSEKHYRRILGLIEGQTVVCGGAHEDDALRIAPTVLRDVSWDAPVMGEEIFGPVLPILPYDTLGEAIAAIEARPHPLALYLFSESREARREVLARCRFGGGCLNDAVVHLATSAMPFGGVGESGMGCYHGRAGFETFSHTRSILDKKTRMDLPVRYQPYTPQKIRLLDRFVK